MATAKKSQRTKPPPPSWQRPAGPILSLMRFGQKVILDFEYSPARVAAVKSIPGARFNAADKSWSVALDQIGPVLALKEFPPTSILNGLGPVEAPECNSKQAQERLREDPFAVDEDVIAAVMLDLVIRFNAIKRRIRVVPRIGSTALRIVKKVKGATYSAFDSAYIIPVEEIRTLLKKLRDKQVSFAVAVDAGAALSGTTALRKLIIDAPGAFSEEELASALLTPFIAPVLGEQPQFRPCYFTTEQFKLAFPGHRRQKGKQYLLDERGLLQLFSRLPSIPFPVWFSSEVHSFIEEKKAEFVRSTPNQVTAIDDIAADIITVPLLWRVSQSGRGTLVLNLPVDSQPRRTIVESLKEVVGCKYQDSPQETLILEIPDSKLPAAVTEVEQICEADNLGVIPKSVSFEALESDTRKRLKVRERGLFFGSLDDISPSDLPQLVEGHASRLFPHQRVAVQWLLETPCAFLGDDMGLGKTLSVLSYFTALRTKSEVSTLLVVCPNSLSRNWAREASMWFPDLRAAVLSGDKSSKAWMLRLLTTGASELDVLTVNYEAVRLEYVTPELEKLVRSRKTLLCLDESQRVKNHTAKTFKAINQIAPLCERRVLLSGTPTPKDVTDLWAQMKILDGGERFGKNFYSWLHRVAELGTEYSQFAVKKFHEDEVSESLIRAQEIMLRRRKERVVNLPPKTFSIREIELTGAQAERYDEIREALILRMRSLSGEQFVREITNILEEYLRAVQVASNPRLIDPEWKGEPAKFLELDEIVTEVVHEQGQKIVIWTNYLGNVRELCERYKTYGAAPFSGEVSAAEREVTVRAFQEESSPRILVAVPAAGGVGITLTAAQTAVYVDKTWNAEHWMQSVDRIHRIGQRGTVNVISLLGCKVDEIIHWNLRRKEQNQARVLGDYENRGDDRLGETGLGLSREELLEALE